MRHSNARLKTWAVILPLALLFAGQATAQAEVEPTRRDRATLAPGDLWVRNVTVVSMEREAPLPNSHVVVRGGRIVWVGAEPAAGEGATVLDGTGKYLVAGLIDGHVHLGAPPAGMTEAQRAARPELARAYNEQLPKSYLYFGFTTVVDLGLAEAGTVARIRELAVAPTVLDCGEPLVMANGYPMRQRPEAERFERFPNFLYDPAQASAIPPRFTPAAQSPEAAVERVRSGGGACLKVFYELGDPAQPWPVPSEAMVAAARQAGQRAGLPLLLHANSLAAHRFAAAVAAAAVAHGLWFWPGLLQNPKPLDALPTEIREVLDAEQHAGIGYMPTLRVIEGLVDLAEPTFLDQPQLRHVVPAELLVWWRGDEARKVASEANPGGPMNALLRSAAALGRLALRHRNAQSGRILFGSDTPSGSVYTNPPGFNGYLELQAMQAAGLTPRQILIAATVENARLFGILERVGTVEVGKTADLLLLDADPLASTAAFDAIHTVIVRGLAFPRAKLAAGRSG